MRIAFDSSRTGNTPRFASILIRHPEITSIHKRQLGGAQVGLAQQPCTLGHKVEPGAQEQKAYG